MHAYFGIVCETVTMGFYKRAKPLIWAHRGASGYKTDNTLEAFDLAIEQGADGIETDVRMSRDGVLFLFHDEYVRLNDRLARPEALTIRELQSINVAAGASDVQAPRQIPTLETVLTRYKDSVNRDGEPIVFSLDVIPAPVGVAVSDLSERIGTADRTVITPSDADLGFNSVVRTIRQSHPTIPIVRTTGRSFPERMLRLLPDRPTGFDWASMRRYHIAGLNFRARNVSAGMISAIQERGFAAYVWDCHDEETMCRFVEYGADALYTNYPDALRRLIDTGRCGADEY